MVAVTLVALVPVAHINTSGGAVVGHRGSMARLPTCTIPLAAAQWDALSRRFFQRMRVRVAAVRDLGSARCRRCARWALHGNSEHWWATGGHREEQPWATGGHGEEQPWATCVLQRNSGPPGVMVRNSGGPPLLPRIPGMLSMGHRYPRDVIYGPPMPQLPPPGRHLWGHMSHFTPGSHRACGQAR